MVVGFGGYVSVPAYLAAWRRELPIVIHEVNVPPGVANRMGMKFTKNVAVGFPHQPQQAESLRDARVVGRAAAHRRSPGWTAPALRAAGAGPLRAAARPAGAVRLRRLVRAPARSTWRWPAAAKKLAHAGIQVLHVQGGRNDPFEVPGRPAGAVRGGAVPVRHAARATRPPT